MREFARHLIGSNDCWLLQGPFCKTSTTHPLPLDWRQTAALVTKSLPAPARRTQARGARGRGGVGNHVGVLTGGRGERTRAESEGAAGGASGRLGASR
jgi:hypothetical protein